MIVFVNNRKRANQKEVGWSHRSLNQRNWSIGWVVQANQSNRLEVLVFHGLVLSVKVKGTTAICKVSNCYGGSKEVEREASKPLKKCRKQL